MRLMMRCVATVAVLGALFVCALATKPPKWDPTYTTKGTLYIPYAEIAEPFYAWYDQPTGQSRIDYYGGMVKTYQLRHVGQFGASLKLAPVTTNELANQVTCLQVNGTADYAIEPQTILPNCSQFEHAGKEQMLGNECDKFVLTDVIGEKRNTYTLWVRYRKSPKYPASLQPIPVRYEMRGFNSLLGSHYDHYYLDYESYSHEDIPGDVFDVDEEATPCVSFPGPGAAHFVSFNPMSEFMHPQHAIVEEHHTNEFGRFISKHGKRYSSGSVHSRRKATFVHNLRFIHSQNRAGLGFSLAVNHLTDRSPEELRVLRGFRPSGVYNGGAAFEPNVAEMDALPVSHDWRLYGAVTPVKDQSVCGSCWSFGTVGAIEGAFFLKNGGNLVRLSQQALIDCSWGYGNNGCDGGEDFRSYQWIKQMGGIPEEEEYGGYLGQDGYCHAANVTLVAPITGWVNVTSGSANALKLALLKNGPVSVAIDASPRSFSFYSHGVYYEAKCKNKLDELDHAVLAVGYGQINGEPYWLVKNSWSTYWGNDGYILMSARDNNCGVMTTPTYVTM